MPTIAIFYGIVIQMFHREHPPPHIHVTYQGCEAWVTIADGEVVFGRLPKTARRLVKRWVLRYRVELERNWERGRRLEPLEWIPGLDDDEDRLG